ncbi:hypothetical protein J2Y69_001936 [Microbacterium resistens]|uniref:SRPBCC family protein n=1 Tax=Microbacterium resistens TaxID=156977 RepID=A0ABU1SCK2_9MICO|nr:hypothetical protein [Microbacterium resistens]MDR6867335.1 hypothetical protein [Microbacterium resistens]
MRILQKLTLDTDADAAWRALHSPTVLAEMYGPFVVVTPLDQTEAQVVASELDPRESVAVQLRLLGRFPIGRQLISVSERVEEHRGATVRILRDSGIPLTGPLAGLDVWDHQMAVSPAPGDSSRTLWRERLVIGGPGAALLWPSLWLIWQWRARRIRSLARTWAHDPESPASPASL